MLSSSSSSRSKSAATSKSASPSTVARTFSVSLHSMLSHSRSSWSFLSKTHQYLMLVAPLILIRTVAWRFAIFNQMTSVSLCRQFTSWNDNKNHTNMTLNSVFGIYMNSLTTLFSKCRAGAASVQEWRRVAQICTTNIGELGRPRPTDMFTNQNAKQKQFKVC